MKKIRVLTGWAKSEKERGKIDVAWLDHIVDWCKAHVDYILYLCSENGRCITGSNHVMDCGRLTMKPQ